MNKLKPSKTGIVLGLNEWHEMKMNHENPDLMPYQIEFLERIKDKYNKVVKLKWHRK